MRSLQQLKHPAFQRILSPGIHGMRTRSSSSNGLKVPLCWTCLEPGVLSRRAEAKLLSLPLADASRRARIGRPGVSGHRCARNSPAGSGCRPTGHFLARVSAEVLALTTTDSGSASPRGDDGFASSFALMKERGAFTGSPSTAYVYAVASPAYEMLGGVKAGSRWHDVPIPGSIRTGKRGIEAAHSLPRSTTRAQRTFVEDFADEASWRPSRLRSRADIYTRPLAAAKIAAVFGQKWLVAAVVAADYRRQRALQERKPG